MPAPIYSYLTISKAINADAKTATFALRYQGQSVAEMVVSAKPGENAAGYDVTPKTTKSCCITSISTKRPASLSRKHFRNVVGPTAGLSS